MGANYMQATAIQTSVRKAVVGNTAITCKVKDLKADAFFVRASQNHKLENTFATMYAKGMILPPLIITPDKRIVDGRTRHAGLVKSGISECQCYVVEGSEPELIALAMASNSGSAPLTEEDIRWSLRLLVAKGMTENQIIDSMHSAGWTPEFTKWHLVAVRKENHNAKMREAERAVKAGVSQEEAAKRCDVTVTSLRSWMTRSEPGKGVRPAESVGRITTSHKAKVETVLDKTLQQLRERKVSEKEVKRAITLLSELSEYWSRKHKNYLGRMNAAVKVAKELVKDIPLEMRGTA